MTSWRNWAGLTTVQPTSVATPTSVDEVVAAVQAARSAGGTVKMPGSGHSFTSIAAPEGTMLRPDALRGITAVDHEALTVTAAAGTPLHELNAGLTELGLSLHNMGDIAVQTVAGATSTGTHGTGGVAASLSAQIAGLELVTGTGEVLRASASENADVFAAARLGLGAVGILTSITFAVEPLFTLEAHEFPGTWAQTLDSFDAWTQDHHHVEFYWFPHTDRTLVKHNDRVEDDGDLPGPLSRLRGWWDDEFLSNTVLGAITGLGDRRPSLVPRINQVTSRGLSERRYSDVPHKVFTSPRSVVFREMEYAVPREAGLHALRDVRAWLERSGLNISLPIEVRVTPADDITLSTSTGRDSMYLAFHTSPGTDHTPYFAGVEEILRGYDGRPHWGKLHTRTAADLAPAYPRWHEFIALRDRLDPDRLFTNSYLRQVLDD